MSLRGHGAWCKSRRRGSFWFARLNRPDKRNALSEPMLRDLLALCDRVAADVDARAIVLWGAGGNFCAGADFEHFQELMASPAPAGPDPIVAHNRAFGAMLARMAELPVPTLGVVRGATMGGGVGLASVLDRVIATRRRGLCHARSHARHRTRPDRSLRRATHRCSTCSLAHAGGCASRRQRRARGRAGRCGGVTVRAGRGRRRRTRAAGNGRARGAARDETPGAA